MKWLLKIGGALVLLIVLVIGGTFFVARFHDGPLEGSLAIVAGGEFETGELQTGNEPDWKFLTDYPTIEFQLLDPARSRRTFIMETEGRIFIPSGYMNSIQGKVWKHWPMEAESDGRAILRVDGKLYERNLVRVKAGELLPGVLSELGRKYGGGQTVPLSEIESNNLWIFELQPRT